MADLGIRGLRRWLRRALGWASFSVVLSGCEGEGPDTSTEIFCTAMCERSVQCGGWENAGPCQSECEGDPDGLEDFRPEFIAKFAACFRRLSCSDFFTENSFDSCWDEVRDGFEPSADTRAFCRDYSRVWFECGSVYFRDECERDWVSFAAAGLDRVAQCDEDVACDALRPCIDAAIEAGR